MSTTTLREQLAEILGTSIPDATWQYLEEKFYVSEVQQGQMSIDTFAEEATKLLRLSGASVQPKISRSGDFFIPGSPVADSDRRTQAISEILAGLARERTDVLSFRESQLEGRLLDFEDVESWINGERETQGPPTTFLKLALKSHELRRDTVGFALDPPLKLTKIPDAMEPEFSAAVLSYATQDSSWTQTVAVNSDSNLGQLSRLSKSLARSYRWQEAQATVFVLTDLIPVVSPMRVSIKRSFGIDALSRVTIVADPTVPPGKITDAFKRARLELLGARPRSLSDKHTSLVRFCNNRPENETWGARMESWNLAHPEWSYPEIKNFIRDANQGLRRLLGKNMKFVSAESKR